MDEICTHIECSAEVSVHRTEIKGKQTQIVHTAEVRIVCTNCGYVFQLSSKRDMPGTPQTEDFPLSME